MWKRHRFFRSLRFVYLLILSPACNKISSSTTVASTANIIIRRLNHDHSSYGHATRTILHATSADDALTAKGARRTIDSCISEFGVNDGYCIIDNFLQPAHIAALANEIEALKATKELLPAGIGRSKDINKKIRGDSIHWITDKRGGGETAATSGDCSKIHFDNYFDEMSNVRMKLNEAYFLGLFSLQSHLSNYEVGQCYAKHLDQFEGGSSGRQPFSQSIRKVSSILYLNDPSWDGAKDGGCLRLYLNNQAEAKAVYVDIAPLGGRLVLFLSSKFHHEVLPARLIRMSLTGWFHTAAALG